MSERASFEEVLDFANKVREAGGGNPLDALMPAVPQDATKCLIAKNLNFNCEVSGAGYDLLSRMGVESEDDRWYMEVNDYEAGIKIAKTLNLPHYCRQPNLSSVQILLPKPIGQVAFDFDRAYDILYEAIGADEESSLSEEEKDLLREMWPYIEQAQIEARDLATIVNEDGSIVI